MLKASALYIVIVIALVMAVLCSSLITAAYFYRDQYQRSFRYGSLQRNLESGINILLESGSSGGDAINASISKQSLFGTENDTVLLSQKPWGLMDIGIVQAFIQHDTLTRVFSMAHAVDSAKWAALYVIDEDRSLSVSGKTRIEGEAYIPKAGIKEAYLNNQAYQGDKRLIIGRKHTSSKTLPALDDNLLKSLQGLLKLPATDSAFTHTDTIKQSFLSRTRVYELGRKSVTIQGIYLDGNIILRSDTAVTIAATAQLRNVIIYARSIIVQSGFQGNAQLYARDSIGVQGLCTFSYPSTLGILRFENKRKAIVKIGIGSGSTVNGTVFVYQQEPDSQLLPVVDLGKGVTVNGQVYVPGLINYKDGLTVNGSVFTNRFLYQTDYTRYENYLINLRISSRALSPYYLTGGLLPVAGASKRILQWLE